MPSESPTLGQLETRLVLAQDYRKTLIPGRHDRDQIMLATRDVQLAQQELEAALNSERYFD